MNTTAKQLHNYMTFRAGREGVEHKLSVSFYAKALRQGCVSFFGVIVRNGRLVKDEQQPALFAEWNKRND